MHLVTKAHIRNQRDADAFNELSIYCAKKLSTVNATNNGTQFMISIQGPDEMLEELRDYLVERNMGVI